MKRSTKILLGVATIWPVAYMLLFFLTIFSVLIFWSLSQERSNRNSQNIDLVELEQKIENDRAYELEYKGESGWMILPLQMAPERANIKLIRSGVH